MLPHTQRNVSILFSLVVLISELFKRLPDSCREWEGDKVCRNGKQRRRFGDMLFTWLGKSLSLLWCIDLLYFFSYPWWELEGNEWKDVLRHAIRRGGTTKYHRPHMPVIPAGFQRWPNPSSSYDSKVTLLLRGKDEWKGSKYLPRVSFFFLRKKKSIQHTVCMIFFKEVWQTTAIQKYFFQWC